jgi:hypothetical protein
MHKLSVETLYHYSCPSCKKWWSIGDIKLDKAYCPHCGLFADTFTSGDTKMNRYVVMVIFSDGERIFEEVFAESAVSAILYKLPINPDFINPDVLDSGVYSVISRILDDNPDIFDLGILEIK